MTAGSIPIIARSTLTDFVGAGSNSQVELEVILSAGTEEITMSDESAYQVEPFVDSCVEKSASKTNRDC